MLSLVEFIQNANYDKQIIESICEITGEEMVNESFQSSLLTELAKLISKFDSKRAGSLGYVWNQKQQSFTSLFAPTMLRNGKILGVQWSKIKDSDWEKYFVGDKSFKKVVRQIFGGANGYIVVKTDDGKIRYVLKGISKKGSYGESDIKPIVYFFQHQNETMHRENKPKYSNTRDLNCNEAIEVLTSFGNADAYVLMVTSDMTEEYEALVKDRKDSQAGVINTDKESLKKIAKEQQARYKSLVNEIKAKKALENQKNVFEEIQQIQQEMHQYYMKLIDSERDMYGEASWILNDILCYSNDAYKTFIDMLRKKKQLDVSQSKYGDSQYGKVAVEMDKKDLEKSVSYLDDTMKNLRKKLDKVKELLG